MRLSKSMRLLILTTPIILFAMSGCKRELQEKSNPVGYSVAKLKNGHISFDTRNDYDAYLNLDQNKRKAILAPLHKDPAFKPFRKSSSGHVSMRRIGDCEIPDDVVDDNSALFDILDENGVTAIGSDLWRVDYCNGTIFLIALRDAGNQQNYNDFLSGNLANPAIGQFPNSVDALDAVEQGYRTMPDIYTVEGNETFMDAGWLGATIHENKYFNDTYVDGSTVTGWDGTYGDNTRMNGKLSYDPFAIYFHFYGKEKYQRTSNVGLWITKKIGNPGSSTYWSTNYTFRYKRKGRNQVSQEGFGTLNPGDNVVNSDNKTDKTFYSGSKGLARRCNCNHASWTVINNRTNLVRVHRNPGDRDWLIFQNESAIAREMPNYDLNNANQTRYFISF